MSCQKVIVQYTKDADKDILFTMKVNEMKVCMDVYRTDMASCADGPRDAGTVRKTEVWPIVYNLRQVDIIKYYGKYSLFP